MNFTVTVNLETTCLQLNRVKTTTILSEFTEFEHTIKHGG